MNPSGFSQILYLSQITTLTLKVPITTAADDSLEYVLLIFTEKIRLDISCESSV